MGSLHAGQDRPSLCLIRLRGQFCTSGRGVGLLRKMCSMMPASLRVRALRIVHIILFPRSTYPSIPRDAATGQVSKVSCAARYQHVTASPSRTLVPTFSRSQRTATHTTAADPGSRSYTILTAPRQQSYLPGIAGYGS